MYLTPSGEKLAEGWTYLHLVLWKYVIFSLVRVETEKEPFKATSVWKEAWRRFERKALAKTETFRTVLLRAESRGDERPNLEGKAGCLAPLATLDDTATISWNEEIVARIKKLGEK